MHEMSLVRGLLRQVAELRSAQGGAQVTEIRVEVGQLSGVDPILLAAAFERAAPTWAMSQARLIVEPISLEALCRCCDARFVVEDFDFRCPCCRSGACRVLRGEGLMLESVVFAAAQSGRAAQHPTTDGLPCPTP